MTLGCGAIAGNITSDNIGPLHLINIKRIAYAVRRPEEAFEVPAGSAAAGSVSVNRNEVVAAVERFLASRGVTTAPASNPARASIVSEVVDRFLSGKSQVKPQPAPPAPVPPPPVAPPDVTPTIVAFVCENDVREAMRDSRKIYVGPKTIITPSARELGDQSGILVLAQR